jgi:hypothetical protein
MGDFMGEMGAMPPPPKERRPLTEKKFGDQMLAFWEKAPLPDDAIVTHVALIPYRGDRAVLPWRQGRMQLPEGQPSEGESLEAAIERIGREQAGILEPAWTYLGHFRCRATVHSKTHAPGTITYRALFGVEVGGLGDFPDDKSFERRIVSQRDLLAMMRERYNEYVIEYTEALDQFIIDRTKRMLAQASESAS